MLYIPVILGTPRQGRLSEQVANYIHSLVAKRTDVTTDLIDIRSLELKYDDAGEGAKIPSFAAQMERADAIIIVCPEYNHGYPGPLKHALDTNLKEYIHKAAGIAGVSAGGWGGVRAIQALLPVLRELGLVTIFWDLNFPGVGQAFNEDGSIKDPAQDSRFDKFMNELVWMANVLRKGRVGETSPGEGAVLACPKCGSTMNRHAQREKVDIHACPNCGAIAESPAANPIT